jgi:hypothetical protein
VAQCTVPNFTGVKKNAAQGVWSDAGFTNALTFRPGNGNYTISFQSIAAGQVRPCTGTPMEVGP